MHIKVNEEGTELIVEGVSHVVKIVEDGDALSIWAGETPDDMALWLVLAPDRDHDTR